MLTLCPRALNIRGTRVRARQSGRRKEHESKLLVHVPISLDSDVVDGSGGWAGKNNNERLKRTDLDRRVKRMTACKLEEVGLLSLGDQVALYIGPLSNG